MIPSTLKSILLCSVLVSFFFSSCGPKGPEGLPPCESIKEAPKDFLDYWFFPAGSQWVYKLDTSVDIYDTVTNETMIYNYDESDYRSTHPRCTKKYVSFLSHSNYDHFGLPDLSIGKNEREEYSSWHFEPSGWSLNHYSESSLLLSYGIMYLYPYVNKSETEQNRFEGINTFKSDIGIFDSTIYITSNDSTWKLRPSYKNFTEMYLAKNVGIVKISYTNGEVWKLVDYKIKK